LRGTERERRRSGGQEQSLRAWEQFGQIRTAVGAGDSSLEAGALAKNTTGIRNTAIGNQALFRNQTGNGNTAGGYQALANNTGSFNIAVGFTAGVISPLAGTILILAHQARQAIRLRCVSEQNRREHSSLAFGALQPQTPTRFR
jgi:hypothetical protein